VPKSYFFQKILLNNLQNLVPQQQQKQAGHKKMIPIAEVMYSFFGVSGFSPCNSIKQARAIRTPIARYKKM